MPHVAGAVLYNASVRTGHWNTRAARRNRRAGFDLPGVPARREQLQCPVLAREASSGATRGRNRVGYPSRVTRA